MPWIKEYGHRGVSVDGNPGQVTKFCGFPTLRKLLNDCPSDEHRLLVLSLFKTGGRISEVLTLNIEQFDLEYQPNIIMVIGMPVRKRRKAIKDEQGKTVFVLDINKKRDVPIYNTEPLTNEWIELFPSTGKFFPFKYNKAYKMVCNLQKPEGSFHGPWFPHRFRAERARQLRQAYNLGAMDLKSFFEMGRISTPEYYAKTTVSDLIDKMERVTW